MSLLKEIHRQPAGVRTALWALSAFVTLSLVGVFWFSSTERQLFFAFDRKPQEEEAFLARQEQRSPRLLASVGRGLSSLTASIGSLFGFDREQGFDRTPEEDNVYLLPLSK